MRVPKDVPNIRALSLTPGWKPEPDYDLDNIEHKVLKQIISPSNTSLDQTVTFEEANLDEEPEAETVLEDDEKLEQDDTEHAHVQPLPIQFLSDKTGKMV